MARVTFLGLDFPDPSIVTRVMAAVRGLFPEVATSDLNDRQAFLAVIRYHLRSWVAQWESITAANPDMAGKQAIQAAIATQQAADAKARQDTTDINLT